MVAWYKDEERFYDMNTSSKENIEVLEYENGKPRTYLKDSTSRKTHSFSFDITSKEDEIAFWDWYDNVLLSRSEHLELTDVISGKGKKEYRVTAEPYIPDTEFPKECNLSIEEV